MRRNEVKNELFYLDFLFGKPSYGYGYYVARTTTYPTRATYTNVKLRPVLEAPKLIDGIG